MRSVESNGERMTVTGVPSRRTIVQSGTGGSYPSTAMPTAIVSGSDSSSGASTEKSIEPGTGWTSGPSIATSRVNWSKSS